MGVSPTSADVPNAGSIPASCSVRIRLHWRSGADRIPATDAGRAWLFFRRPFPMPNRPAVDELDAVVIANACRGGRRDEPD